MTTPLKRLLVPITDLVTLVAGGASGLGRATTEYLHQSGAKVALLDLSQSDGAKVVEGLGQNAIFTPADVTKSEQIQEAIATIRDKYGRLDAVVNCAGISYAFKLYAASKRAKGPMDRFKQVQEVNVMGTANLIQEAMDLIIEQDKDANGQRAVIINTSSIAAFEGQIGQAAYAASKGAVASMTLPLARDFADSGVRVVCIAPGVFDTPLVSSLSPKAFKFLSASIPNPPRMGHPVEFAALVEHIIQNRYINGTVIRIDGSFRMPP